MTTFVRDKLTNVRYYLVDACLVHTWPSPPCYEFFWAIASFCGNFRKSRGTHKHSIHTRLSFQVDSCTAFMQDIVSRTHRLHARCSRTYTSSYVLGNLASGTVLCYTSASCSQTTDHSNWVFHVFPVSAVCQPLVLTTNLIYPLRA